MLIHKSKLLVFPKFVSYFFSFLCFKNIILYCKFMKNLSQFLYMIITLVF